MPNYYRLRIRSTDDKEEIKRLWDCYSATKTKIMNAMHNNTEDQLTREEIVLVLVAQSTLIDLLMAQNAKIMAAIEEYEAEMTTAPNNNEVDKNVN